MGLLPDNVIGELVRPRGGFWSGDPVALVPPSALSGREIWRDLAARGGSRIANDPESEQR